MMTTLDSVVEDLKAHKEHQLQIVREAETSAADHKWMDACVQDL